MSTQMAQGKTIVILSPGFPQDENDSSCLPAIHQFVKALAELRGQTNVVVLSFQYPFERKEYSWHGIKVISLGGANRPGILRLVTWLRAFMVLRKLYRSEGLAGLFACWLTECAFVAKRFAKKRGLKYYFWMQGQDARAGNRYVNRIRPESQELIAISEFIRQEYFRNYKVLPALIIENGVVAQNFPALNQAERTIDILAVGSLIPLKNYTLFIEVIEEVKKSFPQIKAVIVGEGPESPLLQTMVSKRGLQDNIVLAGGLSHDKVLNQMNNSRVFLHPSNFEGNASVLLEALYSGCQVVTKTNPGKEAKNLHLAAEKNEMVALIYHLLRANPPAERVLVNYMENSAALVNRLFPEES